MTAMRMTTPAPYRDDRISLAEGVIEGAWESLEGSCAACVKSLTGWCEGHEDAQARILDTQPILRRLYGASSDEEARAVVAGTPLALAVTGGAVAA